MSTVHRPAPPGAVSASDRLAAVDATTGTVLPTPTARGVGGGRARYLDLLRAVALVRVVTYHAFGWAWLTLAFPSMGVMFALAGSLMARSLDRPAVSVVRGRM